MGEQVSLFGEDLILERAALPAEQIRAAKSYKDIAAVFAEIFKLSDVPGVTGPNAYKDPKSDFGLKVRGIKHGKKLTNRQRQY